MILLSFNDAIYNFKTTWFEIIFFLSCRKSRVGEFDAWIKLFSFELIILLFKTNPLSILRVLYPPKSSFETTNSTNGDFTTLYNTELIITSNNWVRTAQKHDFNNYANFLKVEDSGYTTPYMPTQAYQPATKGYVDSRNWVGTQAQYDQLTPEQWVIYNIIPSS